MSKKIKKNKNSFETVKKRQMKENRSVQTGFTIIENPFKILQYTQSTSGRSLFR